MYKLNSQLSLLAHNIFYLQRTLLFIYKYYGMTLNPFNLLKDIF